MAVAPFFGEVESHHISSCVRTVTGTASWPQEKKGDKEFLPFVVLLSACQCLWLVISIGSGQEEGGCVLVS